jgi:hypothetical protein
MSQFQRIRGLTSDTTSQVPRINPQTHALETIDYSHHEIHSGDHYFVSINKEIPNGGTFNLAFTTPNTTSWAHMLFGVSSELEVEIICYEGVTSFTGGTAITPLNNDRNSANTSGITDMVSDTTVTLGSPIILKTSVLGSGRDAGGEARGDNEMILKQNTKYYLLITNQAVGASNETNINLSFYMHTNRTA